MDKHVYDFTGNTCRLEMATSLTQADFGFTVDGRFDKAAVDAWRGGEAVKLVKLYSQVGTGNEHTYANKPTVINADGTVTRHGCDWDSSTEQLTRSTTDGAIGIPYATNIYGETASSGIDMSTGEIHCLFSPNNRKTSGTVYDPPALGTSNTTEAFWSYATLSNNYIYSRLSAGTSLFWEARNGIGAGGTDQTLTTSLVSAKIKKNQGRVWSWRMDSTAMARYENGIRQYTTNLSAGNITANATFTNGTFRTGRREFSNSSYPAGLFYCIGVTGLLTDIQRTLIQARITACAQQHLITPLATIKGYFDEWVDFRNTNAGTGVLVGDNSLLTINHQTTGSPTFTYNYTIPNLGLVGRRSATDNADNNYIATNSYFGDQHTGSFFVFGTNETNSITGFWHNDGASASSTAGVFTLGIGRDHNAPRLLTCALDSKDPNGYTNGGYGFFDNSAGASISQAHCKYNWKLSNGEWYAEASNGILATATAYGLSQSLAIGDLVTSNASYPSGVDCVIDSIDTTNNLIISAAADSVAAGRGGKIKGARVQFTSTGALPAPLATATDYYMTIKGEGSTQGQRKIYPTYADAAAETNAVDITDVGTGTHTMRIMAVFNVTTLTGGASKPPTPGFATYPGSDLGYNFSGSGSLQLLIADFAKPAAYDPAADLAAREPYMKNATARLYASPFLGAPIGHYDGDTALYEGNASVVHGDGTQVIRNGNSQGNNRQGTDIIWGFKAGSNLTFEQKQRFRLNLYKAFV
jgi:hypothetical protein